MYVLLSIKPEFCERIITGKKRYEFRRRIFRNYNQVKMVFMYATLPVQKIVGAFTIQEVKQGTPEELWEECGEYAGVSRTQFFDYLSSVERAFAIKIDRVIKCDPFDPRDVFHQFHVPQSFRYVRDQFLRAIQMKMSLQTGI